MFYPFEVCCIWFTILFKCNLKHNDKSANKPWLWPELLFSESVALQVKNKMFSVLKLNRIELKLWKLQWNSTERYELQHSYVFPVKQADKEGHEADID